MRRRGARGASSSSPASRGSARPRSSPASCATSGPARGCCSAPATTSRSRGRWGRSATSSAPSRPPLEEALAAGAAPHEIQSLLIAELELPPRPTVLVLEDVHWADDATLDSITVLGRRIGSLPALLVLTFRGGEAAAGPPAARRGRRDPRRGLGLPRAGAALGGRGRLARRRRRRRGVRGDRRQPVLRHRAARLARRRRAAALGRERGARARVPARRRRAAARRARLGRAEPRDARRCSTR